MAHFQGASEGLLTCKIASEIVQPYFLDKPPGEMRKLSRENRQMTNDLVKEGGVRLQAALAKATRFEACWIDDAKAGPLDGTEPRVLLRNVC